MNENGLGREYVDGEVICRQGEVGDRMYVIQVGRAKVVEEVDGKEIPLGELGAGEIFGEMSIVDRKPRSATVRAMGRARVLTLDKRMFLRGVHEDPSLAYRIVQKMSERIRRLTDEVAHLTKSAADARIATGLRRYVIVVSPDRSELYTRLSAEFAGDPQVDVRLDRRAAERRRAISAHEPERRRADRRRPAEGWTIHLASP